MKKTISSATPATTQGFAIAAIETNGIQTRDIVISHDGRYAFIGHQGYNPEEGLMGSVDVLDIANREIVKSIGEGRCRAGKMTNDGRYAFFSCGRVDQVMPSEL